MNRKKGNKGLMAIKLDLAKAYDRVDWLFLKKAMLAHSFLPSLCDLIYECISSPSFSFFFFFSEMVPLMAVSNLLEVLDRVTLCPHYFYGGV